MSETKLILKGSLLVKNAPDYVVQQLMGNLTFVNPKYKQAQRAGRYVSEEDRYVKFYRRRGNSIIVPRGMVAQVCRLTKIAPCDVNDFSVAPKINIKHTGTPRDYQQAALNDILKRRYGILDAATGGGKTFIGTTAVCERNVKTLVLVHNKELLEQWMGAFKEFTDIKEVGSIGGGRKANIQDVTIGIINSVANRVDELKNEFGFLLFDECHRTISPSWIKVINTMRPAYHLGMTATAYRSDGLTKALFRQVGPIVHKVSRKHLEKTKAILVPVVNRVFTYFYYKFNNDYSELMSELTQDDERNILIGECIVRDHNKYKEPIMAVSDRVSHCEIIFALISGFEGIRPVLLHGKLKKKERDLAVTGLRDGSFNVVVATASLLGEGFDVPELNAVMLATPMRFSGRVMQTIGRCLRPSKKMKLGVPRVYDFRDKRIPVLLNSGFARDRVYKKYGWI